jgi:5-formaminoimidazole-4-carboxamide-1-beta-D-ribofuranosyl 5'-monophosphate synthetase
MPAIKNKELPKNIINPFSEEFVSHWDNWKSYRWEEHKFKYKGIFSEQAALMKLNDLSDKDEVEAIEIIKESMANGWRGFFERKNRKINGQESTASNNQRRKDVTDILGSRNYERR